MHPTSPPGVRARYEAMQAVAGSSFLVALLCAVASHYFLSPSLVFAGGSLLSGVFIFLAWLSATKGKTTRTAVFAAIVILLSLDSITSELNSSLPTIMATGLSHLGVALFGLAALAKSQ